MNTKRNRRIKADREQGKDFFVFSIIKKLLQNLFLIKILFPFRSKISDSGDFILMLKCLCSRFLSCNFEKEQRNYHIRFHFHILNTKEQSLSLFNLIYIVFLSIQKIKAQVCCKNSASYPCKPTISAKNAKIQSLTRSSDSPPIFWSLTKKY